MVLRFVAYDVSYYKILNVIECTNRVKRDNKVAITGRKSNYFYLELGETH